MTMVLYDDTVALMDDCTTDRINMSFDDIKRMMKVIIEKGEDFPNGNRKYRYQFDAASFDYLKEGEYREWDEEGLLIHHRFYYGIKLKFRPRIMLPLIMQTMTGSYTQWIQTNPEQEKCTRLTFGIKMQILKYKDQLKKGVKKRKLATKEQLEETIYHIVKNLVVDYCFAL